MKYFLPFLTVVMVALASCKTAQKSISMTTPQEPSATMEVDERQLDTLEVTPDNWNLADDSEAADTADDPGSYALPLYNASHKRDNDLLHTKLEVRFDWEKEEVLGKTTLQLKPYFYPVSSVTLDAKGFEFHKVTMTGQSQPLKYSYDDQQITIQLGKTYTRDQTYSVYIEYTAKPTESGGSAAITSDKGLFFINPRGEEGDKPQQIWTQGETENNSRWFPTIDKPNERCTEEIYVTVDDKYKTLSNGLLASSKKNADGTRTDYWKMDQPHAPYLVMLAVGDFAVVKDKWEGIDVDYYVEPKFEKDARAIFPYTTELLSFYSKKLGVKYPWPKFSQIVVRDYVSGAMENTTAVVFGEFMQRHQRELIDELTNEKVVAHEMFHHWFGDYVTCESWANLTLNEGFANYSEYLWMEHKHGRDAADYHLYEEWNGYLGSARNGIHPLIHFGYEDKENMFDAHSYNKGGSVLHMLRHYVGDDAFFAALNKYLTTHKYQSVEVNDLRLAFEEVTGEDLNWFFNQWYLKEGHPQLNIEYGFDEETGEATMTVSQTQDPHQMPPIFELRTDVDIYTGNGAPRREPVHVTEREQTFRFKVDQKPMLMNFDPEREILAERTENKSPEEYIYQFSHAPRFMDRFEAIQALGENESEEAREVVKAALRDTFWVFKAIALDNLQESELEGPVIGNIRQLATSDKNSQVRAAAFVKLTEVSDTESTAIAKQAIAKDPAYPVVANALRLLHQVDEQAALESAKSLENETNSDIIEVVGDIYISSEDPKYLPFFENKLNDVDGPAAFSFLSGYQTLASAGDQTTREKALGNLKSLAMNMGSSPWRRVAAVRGMVEMRTTLQQKANDEMDENAKEVLNKEIETIQQALEAAKEAETNPDIKSIYDQLIR